MTSRPRGAGGCGQPERFGSAARSRQPRRGPLGDKIASSARRVEADPD